MNFDEAKELVLEDDGSLRDVLIRKVSRQAYRDLCVFLADHNIAFSVYIDGDLATIESALSEFDKGEDQLSSVITFYVGGVFFRVYFFSEDEIEMDFFPTEVRTPSDWQKITSLLQSMSDFFKQPIGVYPESMHDTPLCVFHVTGIK